MIKAMVCDDEKRVLEDLSEKITKAFTDFGKPVQLYSTDDPFSLLEHLESIAPQALFLDIDMPRLGGMDIAQFLIDNNFKTLLIFVTSHDALVYSSFQYRPFAFIRKSHFDDEIVPVIGRIISELQKQADFFTFKNSEGLFRIPYEDILYFESDSNYIDLHCKGQRYKFRGTISHIDSELSGKGFLRIHKGFLVNERHIFAIKGDDARLDNNELLPIGRTNRENVKKAMMRYMR
ncbi:MAG: response regulator transcription factor [Lachnospiraceae bacterium]|nr:response regulator transcription factor [Lachnospiraceae bacterium]